MTLTEILPAVRELSMLDKIRLVRILADELDTAEDAFPFEPYKIYYLTDQRVIKHRKDKARVSREDQEVDSE